MASKSAENSNQNLNQDMEKASSKKHSGFLSRAMFLARILGVFVLFVLVAFTWFQVNRPLPASPHFKVSPAVLAVIKAESGGAQATHSASGKLPVHDKGLSTSSVSLLPRVGQAGKASPPVTTQSLFEVIPERELAKPELKAQVRKINELYRQWIGVVGLLYQQGWEKFQKSPQAKTQPFGEYPIYGYYELDKELWKTSLGAAYQKALSDACLQVLVYYGDWEAASDLCWQHPDLYEWNEILYTLRQIPKPLVKYPRIIVWSAGWKVIQLINRYGK